MNTAITDLQVDKSVPDDTPFSWDSIETISDYLRVFGSDMIKRLDQEFQPIHHPAKDQPFKVLEQFKRPLFEAQAHLVSALIKGYKKNKRQLLIGEMGVGKSSMSVGVLFALLKELVGAAGRVIYMVPNHLIKKTKREIETIIDADLHEIHFLKSYKDVLNLHYSGKFNKKATKIEVYIIARDTTKLGYTYELAAKKVIRQYITDKGTEQEHIVTSAEWVCPDCGGQLMLAEENNLVPMTDKDFYNKHGKPVRRQRNLICQNDIQEVSEIQYTEDSQGHKQQLVEFKNRKCGASLWQAKNSKKQNFAGYHVGVSGPAARKVSPADLFKRYFKNKFDLFIGDECHELAGGSAQAHAFHVLMGCAKYTLAMTGSLSNGYASSLFELFFRMFPARLKKLGFTWGEAAKWIDLYGAREKTTKIIKDPTLNSSSNGTTTKVSYKEQASIAPQLFTDILSDVACFIGLSDLFDVLPDYKEGPMNVPLTGLRRFSSCRTKIIRKPGHKAIKVHKGMRLVAPEWYLKRNLESVERILRQRIKQDLVKDGNSLLLGSLVNTLLSYPDVPFNFNGIYHPDTRECIVSERYKLSERLIYPKEQQLIHFVKSQLKLNRRVCVYGVYTKKSGTLERLHTLLTERGIKSAILTPSVPGPEREEWIAARVQEGIEVLLTHPALVGTGLDLLLFPSIFFYQTGHKLNVVRQASRRHWRIGQANTCLTVYSSYTDSMQELALNLMAAKMSTAMALEGKFSEDGLAALTVSSGGSIETELARRFIGNQVEGVQSAESIWGKMTVDATSLMKAAEETPTIVSAPQEEPPAHDLFTAFSEMVAEQKENLKPKPKTVRKNEIEVDLHHEGKLVFRKGEWAAEWNEELGRYKLAKITSVSNYNQTINHQPKGHFAPAYYSLTREQRKSIIDWSKEHGNHLNQDMEWYMRTVWYHPEENYFVISMGDASDGACREGEMILYSSGGLGELKKYRLSTRFIEEGLIRIWDVQEIMYQWSMTGKEPYVYGVDDSIDKMAIPTPTSVHKVNTQQKIATSSQDESHSFTYKGGTLQDAILHWMKDKLPEDLHQRFNEQISFVEENIRRGWDGFTVIKHQDHMSLNWSSSSAPKTEVDWRRWLYRLSCKSVQAAPSPANLFGSKSNQSATSKLKTKKFFKVTDDQLAFNF